nr:hypothetical protein [Propionicimonas sp.]
MTVDVVCAPDGPGITRLDRPDVGAAIIHPVPISVLPTEQELATRDDTVPVPTRLLAALPPGVFDEPA